MKASSKDTAWVALGLVLICLYVFRHHQPIAGWIQAVLPGSKAQTAEVPESERAAVASPEGTSTVILNKTFAISKTVEVPFQLPPHAAIPQLRGTYESFGQSMGTVSDESGDVELLVLNEEQYEDFRQGKAGDVVFSAPASHDQNVDFTLPATMADPVKYYLVFRSAPGGDKRKVVKANFHVDF